MTAPTVLSRDEAHQSAGALRALVVSGLLLALPGGLLPLWGYHIQTNFALAGDYFLAAAAGLAAGVILTQRYGGRLPISRLLSYACFAGAGALVLLAFAAAPGGLWQRFTGLFLAGMSAGALNTGTLRMIGRAWQVDPAATALRAGTYFAAGSALASLFLAWCFDAANAPRFVAVMAVVPLLAAFSIPRAAPAPALPAAETAVRARPESGLFTVLAFAFALLLFFQFASEWSIAGWLPIILIDRLGISPQSAVDLLAVYWMALAAGRVGTAKLLRSVRHGVLLGASSFCALFGCAALLTAATRFGTVAGFLLAGLGFSAVYPLASEKISARFASYHPGYFNGIFTFALLGGMLVPFALGHAAADTGLRIVPGAAMIGSCAVVLLLMLIWLGRKVSGE